MNPKTSDRLISFSADLHIHSTLSPCAENRMTPEEVLKKIISLGIDVFSITDHNAGFNCAAFGAAAKERGVSFIPGIELQSSEEIHLLGYFPHVQTLTAFCSSIVKHALMQGMKNDPLRFGNQLKINSAGDVEGEVEDMLSMPLSLSVDELVHRVHQFDGIAVAAHLDRGFSVISQLGYIPPELELDAVEIWDTNKIEDIKSTFLKDRDLNITSSSDSHYLDMMKRPKMKLWLNNADVHSCLNCIKGTGPGRITIAQKRKRKSQRLGGAGVDRNGSQGKKDWKSIYK